ncbi:MFS transporter [Sphingoaurantiacus capsulatus]|uniref:MFS transporter n=1 Tax=Sphingoaurantiacus capsulatus TaxID=1771310 RepID=A0ABV7XE05_9SPHN
MAALIVPADDTEIEDREPDTRPAWRRWLVMFILLTGGIKTTLAFTTVVPALQKIAEHFGSQGDAILGAQFVVTMAPAGMAVAGLFAGWIVARWELRKSLFVGLGLSAITGLSQLFLDDFVVLLVSRFLLGASVVTVDIALTTILAAEFAGKARSRMVGFRQAISSIGTVSTMLFAGWLVQNHGWRSPAWMFLVPAVMLLLCVIAFDKPIAAARQMTSSEKFSVWQLWPIYLLSLLFSVAHTMPSFQMPFLLKEIGVTDAVLISRVPALSAFISIMAAGAFAFVYGRAQRMTLVFAATLMGLGFIGVGNATTYTMILVFIIIEGSGAGWNMPFFQNRLLDRVSPLQRSQAMGLLSSSLFLGHFLNPIVTAPLRHSLGIHGTFIAVGSFLVIGAIAMTLWIAASRNRNTVI